MGNVSHQQVEALRNFYAEDGFARAILNFLKAREYDLREATVDGIVADTRGGISRTAVISVLKKLGELGYGEFITGRHGNYSRMRWRFKPTGIGQVAAGVEQNLQMFEELEESFKEIEEEWSNASDEPIQMIEHKYRLRLNLELPLSLPLDLTPHEAKRIADFVLTLPFNPSE